MLRRTSLAIGQNAYQPPSPILKYAVKDAQDIHSKLEKSGFEDCVLAEDEPFDVLKRTIQDKISSLKDGDFFWLFYAGHGSGKAGDAGEVLLLPIDHQPGGPSIPLWEWIIPQLAKRTDCIFVVILDCCRESDLQTFRGGSAHDWPALPGVEASKSRYIQDQQQQAFGNNQYFILHGCHPGLVAQEQNGHGVLTSGVLQFMNQPVPFGEFQRLVTIYCDEEVGQAAWVASHWRSELSIRGLKIHKGRFRFLPRMDLRGPKRPSLRISLGEIGEITPHQ